MSITSLCDVGSVGRCSIDGYGAGVLGRRGEQIVPFASLFGAELDISLPEIANDLGV